MSVHTENVIGAKIVDVTLKVTCDVKSHTCANGSGTELNCKKIKSLPIKIMYNGHEIVGDLFIHKNERNNYVYLKHILILYNVKQFQISYAGIECGQTKKSAHCQPPSKYKNIPKTDTNKNFPPNISKFHVEYSIGYDVHTIYNHMSSSIGEICLQVEIDEYMDVKNGNKFKSLISHEVISKLEDEKNFTITCNGETFQFNKTLLCMISEVFNKMINGNLKESNSNSVEIIDFAPETIRAFNKVAFGEETLKKEDFTADLLMFANKYLIKPLVKKCKKHLNVLDSMTNDNVFDIIRTAYLLDDEEMFKNGTLFLKKNRVQLKGSEQWKEFEEANPKCMIKILKMMLDVDIKEDDLITIL